MNIWCLVLSFSLGLGLTFSAQANSTEAVPAAQRTDPIAPQSMDGFGGVPQRPFAGTSRVAETQTANQPTTTREMARTKTTSLLAQKAKPRVVKNATAVTKAMKKSKKARHKP